MTAIPYTLLLSLILKWLLFIPYSLQTYNQMITIPYSMHTNDYMTTIYYGLLASLIIQWYLYPTPYKIKMNWLKSFILYFQLWLQNDYHTMSSHVNTDYKLITKPCPLISTLITKWLPYHVLSYQFWLHNG